MNIHIAQSIQARNELKRIANVKYQIIGVKQSSPIIGCTQDTLSGAYILSRPETQLYGWEVSNILCNTSFVDTRLGENIKIDMNKKYSGHNIFSYIIPNGINTIKKSGDKITFQIENGKLLNGFLDQSSLSLAKNSIIHFIWDKYGPNKTSKFIDDAQKLVLNYTLTYGITTGFKDVFMPKTFLDKISQIVSNKILESKYNITQYENETDQLKLDTIETLLSSELNAVSSNTGQLISKELDTSNFFYVGATSGAKGDLVSIGEMIGCIGQTTVEGTRVKKRIKGRSLVYFHRDDDTPEARGFIKNSFFSGLKGYELFYNTMGGREGLIDTAIKTATSGYIQRQLIKGLEDLSIRYDGTNRNVKGIIVQLVYGENGINQSSQSEIQFKMLNMNNKDIQDKLCFTNDEIKKLDKFKNIKQHNEKYYQKLIKYRDELRHIQSAALLNYKTIEDKFLLPINLFRITQDYMNKSNKYDLDPNEIEDTIEKFITNYNNRIISCMKENDKYMKEDDRKLKFLLEVALHEYLSPKKCIFEYKLEKKDFIKMMEEIELSYQKSIVEPGEMVGIIAAQTIGETVSQMTLNTKHSAGQAGKGSSNMGVSRIQELLHYSKNIKTPQMQIYFKDEYSMNKSIVNRIGSFFKHLTIRVLIKSAEIYYVVNSNSLINKKIENDNVSNPFFVNNQTSEINFLPFVFRIVLDIEKMLDNETTLLDIKTKFISHWYKNYTNQKNLKKSEKDVISRISRCAILSNNITDKEQIIHIRFSMSSFNNNVITEFLRMIFDDITLKGIENIIDTAIEPEMRVKYDKDGEVNTKEKEFVIYTSGINFEKIKYMKGIDLRKTKCNDISTTLRMYGIEATRQILIHELYKSNNKVNINHFSLLVDQMCHLGEIISIDRHGLSKIDIDPIARASFEKTMDHFVNAALFNEKDTMKSISSRVAVGRVINGGTGAFDLLLDTKKLENSEYTEDETGGRITFIPLEEEPLLNDIIKYSIGKNDFYNPI